MIIPSVKSKLKELILESLNIKYTSESCQDQILTGNNYQSISLGDFQTAGFRTNRAEILDMVNFKNKKVLDLGSNFGEMSRSARSRGAYLVDGFEYDPFFIEIANMINSYNNITRVSFYKRDITTSNTFNENYDIVCAFSVFTYIQNIFDKIAEVTNELFILETHQLSNNFESVYLKNILPHFKYYRFLGNTDWGTNKNLDEHRAIIAFAKNQDVFSHALFENQIKCLLNDGYKGNLDLKNSNFKYLNIFLNKYSEPLKEGSDCALEFANKLILSVRECSKLSDYCHGLDGWIYWTFLLKGYIEFLKTNEVTPLNCYVVFLRKYYEDTQFDVTFGKIISEDTNLLPRIALRFQAMNDFQRGDFSRVHPIYLFNPTKNIERFSLLENGSTKKFSCSHIDGYHRIFAAKFFNLDNLPFIVKHNNINS